MQKLIQRKKKNLQEEETIKPRMIKKYRIKNNYKIMKPLKMKINKKIKLMNWKNILINKFLEHLNNCFNKLRIKTKQFQNKQKKKLLRKKNDYLF